MNCPNCGGPNERSAKFCIHCGSALKGREEPAQELSKHYYEKKEIFEQDSPVYRETVEDRGGCWITFLSFFVPVVGLVLWLVWANDKPVSSQAAKKGFFASLIVSATLFILWFLLVIFMLRNI